MAIPETVLITSIFCAISISIKPSFNTRMYLSLVTGLPAVNVVYFWLTPSTDTFVRFNALISLETVACVTLYPALLSASASSSCVPILLLLINSNIFLCLSVLTTILQSYHFVISINYIQSHFISYSFKKRYPACLYKSCSLI